MVKFGAVVKINKSEQEKQCRSVQCSIKLSAGDKARKMFSPQVGAVVKINKYDQEKQCRSVQCNFIGRIRMC